MGLVADLCGRCPVCASVPFPQLITEKVHQRDATRALLSSGVTRADDFAWLSQARFYFTPLSRQIELEKAAGLAADEAADPPVMRCLLIRIARAAFHYGFEYQGCAVRPQPTHQHECCGRPGLGVALVALRLFLTLFSLFHLSSSRPVCVLPV